METITNIFNRIKTYFISLAMWKRYAFSSAIAFAFLLLFFLFLRVGVGLGLFVELPSDRELASISNPLASELFTESGQLIGKFYSENRSNLEFAQLNDYFKNALVATEDRRYYKHNGVDNRSILRVIFKTILLQHDASGGGSTITQQLAKNLYPRKRYKLFSTLINKFKEMAIAKRIERQYSKDDILLLYANTVSFGEQVFGLQTASKRFFNKEPQDLLLEEAATLVGILKGTSYYSPKRNPERAKTRRNIVFKQMAKYDYISDDTAKELSSLPLTLNYQAPSNSNELARYFKQQVKKEFTNWSLGTSKEDGSKYNLYKDGLKVYTTLDYDLQIAAEKNMQKHMSRLQSLFEKSWDGGRMFGKGTKLIDDHILSDPKYKRLRAEGLNNKEALQVFTTHEERRLWTWDGYDTEPGTKIDSIKHYLSLLHAGILAANPKTGAIKVWVGGNDYGRFQWDNVSSPRQVGSTFKPIVYLAALEKDIDPCTFYQNELRTYSSYKDWTPKNADGRYGGYASMKGALTHSINTVSVQILFETGLPAIISLAHRLGIQSELNPVPSIVLGTSDVSLLEMVSVYSVFANKGKKETLHTIHRIEDSMGNILFDNGVDAESKSEQVVAKEKIELLDELLSSVTTSGTAQRIYQQYQLPVTLKGKTGTTQNQSDGWFIAYHDDLVVGAWVGTQDRRMHFRNLGTGSGGRTALPLVGALFEFAATQDMLGPAFPAKEYLVSCPDTLTTEQYAHYNLDPEQNKIERFAESIFDKIFKKKSNLKKRRREFAEKQLQDQRKRDRAARIAEYNRAKKKWEERLKELKKKYKEDLN